MVKLYIPRQSLFSEMHNAPQNHLTTELWGHWLPGGHHPGARKQEVSSNIIKCTALEKLNSENKSKEPETFLQPFQETLVPRVSYFWISEIMTETNEKSICQTTKISLNSSYDKFLLPFSGFSHTCEAQRVQLKYFEYSQSLSEKRQFFIKTFLCPCLLDMNLAAWQCWTDAFG